MTSIRHNSPPASHRPSANSPASCGHEHDARAMGEAIASARKQVPMSRQPVDPRLGRQTMRDIDKPGARQAQPADKYDAIEHRTDTPYEPAVHERDQRDEHNQGGGQQFGSQPAPIQVTTVAAMPSPQANPAVFAQLLADLWTRENGKGAKEVTVRFGKDAWPATGARLVRNAAGALDIALLVGKGSRGLGARMTSLEDHLDAAGIVVGALAVEDDVQSA